MRKKKAKPIPAGYHSVTPYLSVRGGRKKEAGETPASLLTTAG